MVPDFAPGRRGRPRIKWRISQKTLVSIDERDNLLRGVSWTFVHPHEIRLSIASSGQQAVPVVSLCCFLASRLRTRVKKGRERNEKSVGRLWAGCPVSRLGAGCAGNGADSEAGEKSASGAAIRRAARSNLEGYRRPHDEDVPHAAHRRGRICSGDINWYLCRMLTRPVR